VTSLWFSDAPPVGHKIRDLQLVRLKMSRTFGCLLTASAAAIHLSCLPLWAQQAEQAQNHTSAPEQPSNDRSTVAEQSAAKQSKLPILRLSDGFRVNRVLGDEEWILVSLSALSQNNGTTSGLRNNQFTSSNLFNLGLQIGPFDQRPVAKTN